MIDPTKFTVEKPTSTKLLDPTKFKITSTPGAIRSDVEGYNFNLNVNRYKRFIDNIYPEAIEQQAAYNQSNWNKTGAMLARGLGGEFLVQGFIGGAGSLLELPVAIVDELKGKNADFSNFATRFADNIAEELNTRFPIFRYNPNKTFDYKDFGWWAENGVSVFSSLGMFVPALGEAKIASWVSKGLKGISELNKINKVTGVAKSFKAASTIFDTEKYWQSVAHSALVMRNAENFRESGQVFNTTKEEALSLFQDNTKYNELLNSPVGKEFLAEKNQERTPEAFANFIAAKAAWKNYGMNAANIAFDVMQVAPIFRGMKTVTRATLTPQQIVAKQAEVLGKTVKNKYINSSSFIKGSGILFGEQVSEGAEELVNAISQSEGNWYGKHLLGQNKDSKFNERLGEYLKDPSSWEQAFWGFAGGVTFSGFTRGYRGIKDVIQDNKDPHSTSQRVEEVGNRLTVLAEYNRRMNLVRDGKHPISEEVLTGTEEEIKNAKDSLLEGLEREQGYELGLNASRHGNVGTLLDMLSDPSFKEIMIKNNLTDEVKADKTIANLRQNILAAEKTYNQLYNNLFTETSSKPYLREAIIGKAVMQKVYTEHYKSILEKTRTKLTNLKTNNPAFDALKEANKDNDFDNNLDDLINTLAIDIIQNEINSVEDEVVKQVMQTKADELKSVIKLNVSNTQGKKLTGNFASIQDIIQTAAEAKVYETILHGENTKFETYSNPKTAIPTVEKAIKTETLAGRTINFGVFNKKLDDNFKITKEDTTESFDKKIAEVDNLVKTINDNIDPYAEEGNPLRKLDDEFKKKYLDVLDNLKKRLLQAKTSKSNIDALVNTFKEDNEKIVTNLNKALKDLGINNLNVKFTGAKHIPYISHIENILKNSNNPFTVLYNLVNNPESVDDDTRTALLGFLSSNIQVATNQNKRDEFFNAILKTVLGYKEDYTIDSITTNSTRLDDAKAFKESLNNTDEKKVIDLGAINPITPSKVDLANKWITNLINNTTSGKPLFQEKTSGTVFIQFEPIAAAFAESVTQDEFKEYYPLLKEAYLIIRNAKVDSKTGVKYKYNQESFINSISADYILNKYNVGTEFKDYEFFSPTNVELAGGKDELNVYNILNLKDTVERDNNGNLVVSNDDASTLDTLLNSLQSGLSVRIRVHTEYKGSQGFSQNKNKFDTIPLVVEVVDGDKVVKVAAINTLNNEHYGVKYNFKGTDWTDSIIDDSRNSNIKLAVLEKIYPLLQSWFNGIKFGKSDEVTSLIFKQLLEEDSIGLLNELIGREKDIRSETGIAALKHICRIMFHGENTDTTAPTEFNRANIISHILSWKDILFRDYTNTLKVRQLLGTDTTKIIETTLSKVTSGNIIKSINDKGETVYHNLNTLGKIDEIKLYRLTNDKAKTTIINTKDGSKITKPYGSYKFPLFVGIQTKTGIVPIPVFTNTLNGNKAKSNNSKQLIDFIYNKLIELGNNKIAKKSAKDNGATDNELTKFDEKSNQLEKELRKVIKINFGEHTGDKDAIYLDYKSATLITTDSEGREQRIIYNNYTKTFKYERIDGNTIASKDITEDQFKIELGKLSRQVDYDSFNNKEYTDVLGNTYSNYEEYLIKTGTIVTDIGSVVNKNGKFISHFTPRPLSNKGGYPLMININTANLRTTSPEHVSFSTFLQQYPLPIDYNFAFELFDGLVKQGIIKFNKTIQKNDAKHTGYIGYDPNTKTINVYDSWVAKYKENPREAAFLMVHDIIHGLVGTKSKEEQTKLISILNQFKKDIIDSTEYKAILAKETKTQADNNIIAILNLPDSEEILTYGLTNLDFAQFLNTIKGEVENKTESFYKRFVKIIKDFLKSIGVTTSKLDELDEVFASFMEGKYKDSVEYNNAIENKLKELVSNNEIEEDCSGKAFNNKL